MPNTKMISQCANSVTGRTLVNVPMRLLCFLLALCISQRSNAEWEAPTEPDPHQILDDAERDVAAGRYEDALARLYWFHNHAEEHNPHIGGVRLSVALSSWRKLADVYKPALELLRETRDKAAQQVLSDKKNAYHHFHDFKSINKALDEQERTVQMFKKLDKQSPEIAKTVYILAQSALIAAREIRLCGDYIQVEDSYRRYAGTYDVQLEWAKEEPTARKRRYERSFAVSMFVRDTATLVALLVKLDRQAEAKSIADRAMKKLGPSKLTEVLEASIEGNFPPPLAYLEVRQSR